MSTQLANSADRVSAVAPAVFAGSFGPRVRAPHPDTVGPILHYPQDREIYGEGDDAGVFFKVVAGVVRTCKFLSDGRRQIDAFLVAGDVFGIEAGSAYSLSAEAVCDCTVTSYRRRGLELLAASNVALSQQLFAYAMRNTARAQEHSLLLGRKSALEKVAAFLIELAVRCDGSETIVLAMTRQDIADYLGLTIETVSRTLSQLERDQVIELLTARQVRLRNPAALQSLNS